MKCANCDSDAVYVTGFPAANDVYLCSTCLPMQLRGLAAEGLLNIPTQTSKSKKATASVDAAPVVDATPAVDNTTPDASL